LQRHLTTREKNRDLDFCDTGGGSLKIRLCPAFAAHIFGYKPERESNQQGDYYKVVKVADYGNKIGYKVYGTEKIRQRASQQDLGNAWCALMRGQRFIAGDLPFNFGGRFFEHQTSFPGRLWSRRYRLLRRLEAAETRRQGGEDQEIQCR